MLAEFRNHVAQNFPEISNARILVAVSGGIDSMTLVELCLKSEFTISLAHCNFSLRGAESDLDAAFVSDFAASKGLTCHIERFDTRAFADDFGLSIQVAARDLRYKWFTELADANGYDFILTAHHLDDTIETFLINLSRGTGLDGLTGIPARNGRIVRPLLNFTREQIYRFASQETISWREDSSNDSTLYIRNVIRHDIVPRLKSLNGNFEESFANTLDYLQQARSMVRDAAVMAWRQVTVESQDHTLFRIEDLRRIPDFRAYLHFWLRDFGFTAWDDVYRLVDAESGKRVLGKGYVLARDRETLVLSRTGDIQEQEYDVGIEGIQSPIAIEISRVPEADSPSRDCIYVDAESIKIPFKIRRCRQGDYFYPAGMEGSKKVSKFLRDQKLSTAQKNATWLLLSGGEIIWVVGQRQDRRFCIKPSTHHTLQIKSWPKNF